MCSSNENIAKGETIRTHCNKCGQDTNHQVLMDYCETATDILDSASDFVLKRIDYTFDFKYDYQIIRCSGCDTISYRSYKYNSEVEDSDGYWEERYPAIAIKIKKEFKYLPSTLIQIYEEVIMTYNNNGFILCAAGIRAVLEGICKNKGITDGVLKKKIINMREQGFISSQQENILHKLRFLGNDALHDLQMPTKEEIDAALDIIENIIESLYEILGKANILKQKEK
jgi:uncharacterized C2H2 Zn-finger protein